MNAKLKSLLQQLLRSPQRFPVEAALGLVFFVIAVLSIENKLWSGVSEDILLFFIPLVVFSFWLQRINRWAYYVSFFIFMPLLAVDLKPFLFTFGHLFTYVLAGILLLLGNRRMENRSFVSHAIHIITQMFFGFLISGLLNLALLAIVNSFLYIFGFGHDYKVNMYITLFVWFVLAPQICCTFIRQDEDDVTEPAKVMQIILNYILSPAVIIYTVILYVYFIKIVFEWELPKGSVAWMVMGFFSVALAGRMSQAILSQRYYDWFYRHFSLIAIPPLILFWVGSIYRIRIYSFTESRFYLVVAGVLMTFFILMLLKERSRRYQLMPLIFGLAIILFTYIPGISARNIGLSCQKHRLKEYLNELNLTNMKTGQLVDSLDMKNIRHDSLLCEKYKEVCSVIDYVRKDIGAEKFKQQYGNWGYSEYHFLYEKNTIPILPLPGYIWHSRTSPVELGDYDIILPQEDYEVSYENGVYAIKRVGGDIVLEYPIDSIFLQDTTYLANLDMLMTYRNDSLMLLLDSFCITDSAITDVSNEFMLFKKGDK